MAKFNQQQSASVAKSGAAFPRLDPRYSTKTGPLGVAEATVGGAGMAGVAAGAWLSLGALSKFRLLFNGSK